MNDVGGGGLNGMHTAKHDCGGVDLQFVDMSDMIVGCLYSLDSEGRSDDATS